MATSAIPESPVHARNGDSSTFTMNRDEVLAKLERDGFVVIPGVISGEDCDVYARELKQWANKFEEHGIPFKRKRSVIQSYRAGHFNSSWQVRLKSKKVFSSLWGTEKLLSSTDGIAIFEPPEDTCGPFRNKDEDWLHLDQGAQRVGRHAYQGAVYLEEQTEEDYCFRVLSKSHKFHSEFFQAFPKGIKRTRRLEFYKLSKTEKEWYYHQGCEQTLVPVPKGGIVLWDSRTIHDTVAPKEGRQNKDRWRFVIFVSMTPAIWAEKEDLRLKRDFYRRMMLTSHWSSQGVGEFAEYKENPRKMGTDITIQYLPDIARTKEAKQLCAIEPYDFEDDEPNGPKKPKWQSVQ